MIRLLAILSLLLSCATSFGQSYAEEMIAWRKKYVEDLLAEKRQPVKPAQAKYISFYRADEKFRITASLTRKPGSRPFMVPTHSGKQKPFQEFGVLKFTLDGEEYELHAYQSVDLIKDTVNGSYLFVPFRDRTNYEETYGGGRYIDLDPRNIKSDGTVVLDFNKCYNPYCAYADGFNCPIPPDENTLPIEITAGEKNFVH